AVLFLVDEVIEQDVQSADGGEIGRTDALRRVRAKLRLRRRQEEREDAERRTRRGRELIPEQVGIRSAMPLPPRQQLRLAQLPADVLVDLQIAVIRNEILDVRPDRSRGRQLANLRLAGADQQRQITAVVLFAAAG